MLNHHTPTLSTAVCSPTPAQFHPTRRTRIRVSYFSSLRIVSLILHSSILSHIRSLPSSLLYQQRHSKYRLSQFFSLFPSFFPSWTSSTFKVLCTSWVRSTSLTPTYGSLIICTPYRTNCIQIPKLKIACATGVNGQRTMWSHCEQCGAISMVESD